MKHSTAAGYLQRDKRHYFDETPKPAWADGPDGRPTKIDGDERFDQLFAEWQADACEHPAVGVVFWVNGGNQPCFNWFCRDCGLKLSPNIPRPLAENEGVKDCALDTLASRERNYLAQRKQRLDQMKAAAAERAQPANRETHSDYLRSDAWRELRAKVLRRAAGICEGCLDAPAEQVHHLTYAHYGHELAYELRALCGRCHERVHELTE